MSFCFVLLSSMYARFANACSLKARAVGMLDGSDATGAFVLFCSVGESVDNTVPATEVGVEDGSGISCRSLITFEKTWERTFTSVGTPMRELVVARVVSTLPTEDKMDGTSCDLFTDDKRDLTSWDSAVTLALGGELCFGAKMFGLSSGNGEVRMSRFSSGILTVGSGTVLIAMGR